MVVNRVGSRKGSLPFSFCLLDALETRLAFGVEAEKSTVGRGAVFRFRAGESELESESLLSESEETGTRVMMMVVEEKERSCLCLLRHSTNNLER
jgi:hypothetical protein